MIKTAIHRTALYELYHSPRMLTMFTLNRNYLEETPRKIVGALRHARGIQDENIMNLIFLFIILSLLHIWNAQTTMLFTGCQSSSKDLKVGNV